jgi:MFS family permease
VRWEYRAKRDEDEMGQSSEGRATRGEFLPLLAICTLIYLLDGLVHSILGPQAPDIETTLRLSHAEMGPIFSANLLGQCIGLIAFPLFAGRLGNRNLVILTVTGFGLFQTASALAADGQQLFALRLITGLFLGGCLPTCLAMVTAAARIERRGLAITTLFTGYGLGATIAGVVVGLFGTSGDWRTSTIVVGVCCLAAAAVAWLWLREPRSVAAERGDDVAVATSNPLVVLRHPYLLGTLMLWLLFVAMLTISYCLNSWLPILLVDVGHDRSLAAVSVSIFSLGGIVAALIVGLLIDRLGAFRVLIAFLVLSAITLFAVGQVLATAPATVLLLLLGICGFFVLGAYGGVNVVLASFYPGATRALGIGWAKSVGRIGTVVAPILIGFALTNGIAETTVMSLFAVPAIVAMLTLVVIATNGRRQVSA